MFIFSLAQTTQSPSVSSAANQPLISPFTAPTATRSPTTITSPFAADDQLRKALEESRRDDESNFLKFNDHIRKIDPFQQSGSINEADKVISFDLFLCAVQNREFARALVLILWGLHSRPEDNEK
jgi:hypothetical protein